MRKLLFQGAESRIFVDNFLGKKVLVKERFQKHYRHPELDNNLTRERIKAECRNIVRCKQFGIKTPAIYYMDLENRLIYLEYFAGSTTVKDYFQDLEKNCKLTQDEVEEVAHLVGDVVARMHSNNIVHGDLTTSNFLLVRNERTNEKTIVVIDFGLSHVEASDEDKGVDLYLLERALSSLSVTAEEFFVEFLKRYTQVYRGHVKQVLDKYQEVRARGRKRCMIG